MSDRLNENKEKFMYDMQSYCGKDNGIFSKTVVNSNMKTIFEFMSLEIIKLKNEIEDLKKENKKQNVEFQYFKTNHIHNQDK
jgi:hypothetical protein